MTFQSILFKEKSNTKDVDAAEMPAFFIDLNLNQVVNAITAGRQEYNLKPFFYFPLTDVDLVNYRQEVARDLEDKMLFEMVKTFSQQFEILRRYRGLVDNLDYKNHKEGWFLEAVLVYCEAVSTLAQGLAQVNIKSRGLVAFRDYITAYVNSDHFKSLEADAVQRKKELSSIQYSIIIKGNWVRVRKYESEIDYTYEVERTFEKFKQGAVKDYTAKNIKGSGMTHVEAQILNILERLYPEIFKALDDFCVRYFSFIDETIGVFDREIQFFVSYLEFIQGIKNAGLRFCYPTVSGERKDVQGVDCFDLALANKQVKDSAPVICNDFYLAGNERIIIVSGPNQGGKTTFARMFGQLHYLASLGLPVPGREARLFLYDRLFTHFEKEEKIKDLRGKLQDELVRIRDILNQASSNSIIILNEIYTSTTLQDAIFLSKKVLERIIELDLICVCVTFIDELSTLSEKTISMVSTVVPENPATRTFKIIRKPSDGLAYAISIAEKYHLTYHMLKERIQG